MSVIFCFCSSFFFIDLLYTDPPNSLAFKVTIAAPIQTMTNTPVKIETD